MATNQYEARVKFCGMKTFGVVATCDTAEDAQNFLDQEFPPAGKGQILAKEVKSTGDASTANDDIEGAQRRIMLLKLRAEEADAREAAANKEASAARAEQSLKMLKTAPAVDDAGAVVVAGQTAQMLPPAPKSDNG